MSYSLLIRPHLYQIGLQKIKNHKTVNTELIEKWNTDADSGVFRGSLRVPPPLQSGETIMFDSYFQDRFYQGPLLPGPFLPDRFYRDRFHLDPYYCIPGVLITNTSCAIAKITVWCVLYMGVLKIFWTPWLRQFLLNFSWAFVPIDLHVCAYKIWSPQLYQFWDRPNRR